MHNANYIIQIQTMNSGNFFTQDNVYANRLYLQKILKDDKMRPYSLSITKSNSDFHKLIIPAIDCIPDAYDQTKNAVREKEKLSQDDLVAAFVESKFYQRYYNTVQSNYASSITGNVKKLTEMLNNIIGEQNVKSIEDTLNRTYQAVFNN